MRYNLKDHCGKEAHRFDPIEESRRSHFLHRRYVLKKNELIYYLVYLRYNHRIQVALVLAREHSARESSQSTAYHIFHPAICLGMRYREKNC